LLLDVVPAGQGQTEANASRSLSRIGTFEYAWRQRENIPEGDRLLKALEQSMSPVGRLAEVKQRGEARGDRVRKRRPLLLDHRYELPEPLGDILVGGSPLVKP